MDVTPTKPTKVAYHAAQSQPRCSDSENDSILGKVCFMCTANFKLLGKIANNVQLNVRMVKH